MLHALESEIDRFAPTYTVPTPTSYHLRPDSSLSIKIVNVSCLSD